MPLMHLTSNYRHLVLTIVLGSSGVYRAISALVLGLKPVLSGVLAERARKYGSILHRQVSYLRSDIFLEEVIL